MTKNIVVGVIVILALFVIVNTFMDGSQQQTQVQEPAEIDLCNEISIPSASVHCGIDPDSVQRCYLVVSGDSRVDYEYSILGGGGELVGTARAGVRRALEASSGIDRIEIIPSYKPQNEVYKRCSSKKIIIYQDQFSGV